jgi:putative ABC transport system permease protein
VGDRVSIINVQNGIRFEQAIVGFVDEPTSPVVYISAEQLSALAPSGVMLKLAAGVDAEAKRDAVTMTPGVAVYLSTESISAAVRKVYSLYNVMVLLTLLSAGVMAAALLYSAMSANVSERTGELGTLQAAGMGTHVLGRLVSTENMMLAVIGLPGGLVAGALLAQWFLSTYTTEGYRWHLVMHPATPVFVSAAILVAGLLAQIPTFRVIGRLDLAKVLRERSL